MGWINSKGVTEELLNDLVIPYHEDAFPDKIHDTDHFFIVVIRDYYFSSMGNPNKGDHNILDGLIAGYNRDTGFLKMVKGNADPSFANRNKARLIPQVMRFYRGDHRGQYWAFRPFPEGKRHPCTRSGRRNKYCSHTNFHGCKDKVDGRGYDTWSEGCFTTPITFFRGKGGVRQTFYDQIENHHETIDTKAVNYRYGGREKTGGVKHFPLILMEKRIDTDGKVKIFTALDEPLIIQGSDNSSAVEKIIHTVKPGDYLGKIAKKYGVTVSYIKQKNQHLAQISVDVIYPGQELIIRG